MPQALKRVASELREEEARPIVFEFLKRVSISMDAYEQIRKTLTEEPAKKWAEDAWVLLTWQTHKCRDGLPEVTSWLVPCQP